MSAKKKLKLTAKQKSFCEQYLIDCNATQAAIRAGYNINSAKEGGYENLTKPHVKEYMSVLIAQQEERTLITADSILIRLNQVANRCMQAELVIYNDSDVPENAEYQFNAAGANKALELLGKHLGMFVERKEVSGPNGDPIPLDSIFEFIPVNSSN